MRIGPVPTPHAISAVPALLAALLALGCGGKTTPSGPPPPPQTRTLGAAVHYTTNGIRAGQVAIGDLNGDGRNDVALIEAGGGSVRVLIYYQTAGGLLQAPVTLTVDIGLRGIAIGDVNGDQKADLALSGASLTATVGHLGRLVVYRQNPATGALLPPAEHVVSANSLGDLAIGDLNGDGRMDVAVTAEPGVTPGMGTLSLFYQTGAGALGAEVIYDRTPVRYTGEIVLADVSGDGRTDVVMQTGELQFSVIVQTPAGTLSDTPHTYDVQTGYWPSFEGLAVGDVNGDGKLDVVVVDPGNNGSFHVFVQAGGVLTGPTQTPSYPDAPYGIEIGDVDGDGRMDILGDLTAPSFPTSLGYVMVFHQTASRTFPGAVNYTFATVSGGGSPEHQSLAYGDVTGDGFKDAVMAWADEGLWVLPSVVAP